MGTRVGPMGGGGAWKKSLWSGFRKCFKPVIKASFTVVIMCQ